MGRPPPLPQGAANLPWEYSYGCVLSAPSKQIRSVYRVDVFVYRGFNDAVSLQDQNRPAGHFVTYVSELDDYTNPD